KLLLNGGEFKIIGNAASGTNEQINSVDVSAGTVTLSGGGTLLTSAPLKLSGPASAGLVRGTNLGSSPGPATANWFGSVTLAGANGAAGSPLVGTVPHFMADANASGTGADLLTYSAATGFRPLTVAEYTGVLPEGNRDLTLAPNISLT